MLEIRELDKHFFGVHALCRVSITLQSHSVLALVGDNGAGKSTLMKCVSGVETPDAGNISFGGQPVPPGDPQLSRLAGIEMIYQDLALCKKQDVVTNVFLGREIRQGVFLNRNLMARMCREACGELGLQIPLHVPVESLSGGQQQSVAIMRAMLSKPRLLIMDEPTAALAVRETQRVLDLIARLRKTGVSVVIITHRLSDVFEVADRIVVMRHGEITHDLSPTQTDLRDLSSKIMGA